MSTSKENIAHSIQTLEALQKLIQADTLTRNQLQDSLDNIITSLQQSNAQDNQQIIKQLTGIRDALQNNPSFTDSTLNALKDLQQLNTLHADILTKN
ncbi:hypothetical protein OL548_27290 [Lysinibacillus sp. MHQ-1]|nr:hypothetical protein OL548_27290 [Lysinibacillus sp. MHQ-1]